MGISRFVATVLSLLSLVASARAQALRTLTSSTGPAGASEICGQPVPPPNFLPPTGSGPVVYLISPCFERQGGRSRIGPEAYLRDIQLKPSRPSRGEWTPYDAAAEQVIFEDFQRLLKNRPLNDLSVEIRDYAFSNGVIGKLVSYNMIERP